MIGTSDQPCWLAEGSCKNPPLEGLWINIVTVYKDRNDLRLS